MNLFILSVCFFLSFYKCKLTSMRVSVAVVLVQCVVGEVGVVYKLLYGKLLVFV